MVSLRNSVNLIPTLHSLNAFLTHMISPEFGMLIIVLGIKIFMVIGIPCTSDDVAPKCKRAPVALRSVSLH